MPYLTNNVPDKGLYCSGEVHRAMWLCQPGFPWVVVHHTITQCQVQALQVWWGKGGRRAFLEGSFFFPYKLPELYTELAGSSEPAQVMCCLSTSLAKSCSVPRQLCLTLCQYYYPSSLEHSERNVPYCSQQQTLGQPQERFKHGL